MTQGNNLIITFSGIKFDGKSTCALYFVEMNNKPSIIIDIAQQFEDDRKYKKIVHGVQALKYEVLNNKLFCKSKMQLIFRPFKGNLKKQIEEVVDFIMSSSIKNISMLFDEFEVYANNKLNENSSLFTMFYLSRNKNIDLFLVSKIFGMLSPLVKSATDYYALSQIDDENSEKFLNRRSFKRFSKESKDMKQHEFLYTDLKKYWRKHKFKKSTVKIIDK